jgi:4-amino-4-deoxy-L-arabinose transferase-like glycosyltransferase
LTPSLLVSHSSFSPHSGLELPNPTDKVPFEELVGAFLAGWLLRIIVALLVFGTFLNPNRGHWEFGYEIGRVARSIVEGSGFSNPYWANTGPTALLTPVYPYFLASIFAILGVYTKASALAFIAANTFFSAITMVPIYLIARRHFDFRTARLAAWVWAFFPYAIHFSGTTMWYHSFVALLLAVIFLTVLALVSSANLASWAVFGVLLGFSALTNPVLVATVPFLAGWLWVQRPGTRRRALLTLTAGLVAMTVTIVPWLMRNEQVLHHPIAFKDGFWMEVCVGNVNGSLHWWDGKEQPSGSASDNAAFEHLGESNYMAWKRSRALVFIENRPAEYVRRCIRRVIFMWTGFWSLNRGYLRQEPFDPENIFFLSSLSLLSLAGLHNLVRANRGATATLYLLIFFSFPIPYYLSHLDPGFRHPVDPLLVILACSTVARWWTRARKTAANVRNNAELVLSR